jgi:adenine C2-methylase RlmN of 23S rRNA A2503 and tRNA A37
MKSFFDYTRSEVAEYLGRPARAARLYKAVYRECALSSNDRPALEQFNLELPPVVTRFESVDGTRRYLLRLRDGEVVESVLIPERRRMCAGL